MSVQEITREIAQLKNPNDLLVLQDAVNHALRRIVLESQPPTDAALKAEYADVFAC